MTKNGIQPLPGKGSRHLLQVCCAVLLLAGCSRYVDVEPSAEQVQTRQDVMSFLESTNEEDLLAAFNALADRAFTQHIRTSRLDANGRELASENQTIEQHADLSVQSSERDVQGDFSLGGIPGLFASDRSGDVASFQSYTIPEDRGYNNPRHENKYRYQFLDGGELDGRAVRMVDIRVLEAAVEEVSVQRAIITTDVEAGRVVRLFLETAQNGLLFTERTSIELRGAWTSAGGVVPQGFRASTTMKSTLSEPVTLILESSFEFPGSATATDQ